jgi:transcriptional regulator with XRE-family HTH domain
MASPDDTRPGQLGPDPVGTERSRTAATAREVGRRIQARRKQLELNQSELAARLSRTQTAVSYWEAGKRMPGLEDLLDLSVALDVDVAALMPDAAARRPIAASLRAVADQLDLRSLADALEGFAREVAESPAPKVRWVVTATGAREAAEQLLEAAGVTSPPVDVDDLARGCGVRVADADFDGEVDGLVVQLPDGGAIGLDRTRTHPARRRFTLAHELGHHLLRHSAAFSVDFADAGGAQGNSPTYNWRHERAANEFAANLLMPAALVRKARKKRTGVADLAEHFQVSKAAMGHRLTALGLRG